MPIALLNAKMNTSNRMHGGVLALGLLMGRHIREAKERVRGVGMRSAARKGTIRASVGEKLLVETFGGAGRSVRSAPWIRSASASLSLGAVAISHDLLVRLLLR
jgi:hypothetical protein